MPLQTVSLDGIDCQILAIGGRGKISGNGQGDISASITYQCDWSRRIDVFAYLLGYPPGPSYSGRPRTPHAYPDWDVLQASRCEVEGVGEPSYDSTLDAIAFSRANLATEYRVLPFGGNDPGDGPDLTDFENIPFAEISLESSSEVYVPEESKPYKWAAQSLRDGPSPTQRIGVHVPVAIHTIALHSLDAAKVNAGLAAIRTAAGSVNDSRYNGARAGHLLFKGLTMRGAVGGSIATREMALVFHERLPAPWNYAYNPNIRQTNGPYARTNWWPLTPEPYPSTSFGTIFGALVRD